MLNSSRCDDVLIALRRIIRATDLYSRQLSREVGLTAPQLLVIQAIQAKDEITMGEIADEVSLSQATVTTILDRLEKREFIRRQRGESDKRKVYATLTDAGAALAESAPTPLQNAFTDRFSRLDDWEQTLILSSLQRVASMMNADQLDAAPLLDVGAADRGQAHAELSSSRQHHKDTRTKEKMRK